MSDQNAKNHFTEKVYQAIEFNLNVTKLMLNNNHLSFSEKSKEKIIQFLSQQKETVDEQISFSMLDSVIEAAARRCKNNLIESEDIILSLDENNYLPIPTGLKLEDLERKYILQTLYFVQQNRTKAADILGISIRTLRNKINQYRLEGYL